MTAKHWPFGLTRIRHSNPIRAARRFPGGVGATDTDILI